MTYDYRWISILILSFITACSQQPSSPSYVVESIEDGDTIIIRLNEASQRIQLSGIDAPEDTENAKLNVDINVKGLDKQALLALGNKATNYLASHIAVGQNVTLAGDLSQKDQYGRIPAIVFTEKGKSLNLMMVEEGYAVLLKRFPLEDNFKASLKKAEQQAILNEKGLWKTERELMTKWSGR